MERVVARGAGAACGGVAGSAALRRGLFYSLFISCMPRKKRAWCKR